MEQEIWKPVVGYEGLYQVSSLGRVKSCENFTNRHERKEKILKPGKINGYQYVALCKNGVVKWLRVHRLVATAFIPNDNLFSDTVNHKNEVKTDNRVENLEWMSQGDNVRYSQREGGTGYQKGSKHPQAKPVRCVETGQVFGCAADASRWFGFNSLTSVATSIRLGCRAGGYHFEYV